MKNKKSLGQHWLKDRAVLDTIAQATQTDGVNTCLEIGPGLGTLTSALLRQFQTVIAIEYDQTLAVNLPKSFPGKDLTVVQQDFLQYDLDKLPQPYVVAGNIPYYITSPIIKKLLTTKNSPVKIVLLIQKEVAERLVASAGQHTLLSLSTQNYATAEFLFAVPKYYFTPPPKVDSAVIKLTPRVQPLVQPAVLELAKQGFSNPRKKLMKNLPYAKEQLTEIFARLQINPNARPADLSLTDWQKLDQSLKTCQK